MIKLYSESIIQEANIDFKEYLMKMKNLMSESPENTKLICDYHIDKFKDISGEIHINFAYVEAQLKEISNTQNQNTLCKLDYTTYLEKLKSIIDNPIDIDNRLLKYFIDFYNTKYLLSILAVPYQEIATKTDYSNLQKNIEKSEKNVKTLSINIKETQEQIAHMKTDIMKEMLTQLISVVAIFVGIAFVMFGGMSLLNDLFDFSNMKVVPLTEIICLGSLFGLIIIYVIYAFIIFVYKITKVENISKQNTLDKRIIIISIVLIFIFSISFCIWIHLPSKINLLIRI